MLTRKDTSKRKQEGTPKPVKKMQKKVKKKKIYRALRKQQNENNIFLYFNYVD